MSVMRNRPKGARFASFGLGLCGAFTMAPSAIGYQDIASLLARQPGVAERWQTRAVAGSAAKIQVATFSFGRPIGTAVPQTPWARLASLEALGPDTSLGRNPLMQPPRRYEASDFPTVDRTLKGDRLAVAVPDLPTAEGVSPEGQSDDAATPNIAGAKSAEQAPTSSALDPELAAALQGPPLSQYDGTPQHETPALGDNGSEIALGGTTVQPAHGVDIEGEEPGQRQVDVLDLPHVDAVAEAAHPGDLVRGEAHRVLVAQPRPLLATEVEIGGRHRGGGHGQHSCARRGQ